MNSRKITLPKAVDNLDSTSTTNLLSANQGKILGERGTVKLLASRSISNININFKR